LQGIVVKTEVKKCKSLHKQDIIQHSIGLVLVLFIYSLNLFGKN